MAFPVPDGVDSSLLKNRSPREENARTMQTNVASHSSASSVDLTRAEKEPLIPSLAATHLSLLTAISSLTGFTKCGLFPDALNS